MLVSADGQGGGGPGGGASTELTTWVEQHGEVVDGVESGSLTLYRVTA